MWCLSFFFVTEFAHEQSPDAEVLRKPMPRGCSLVLSRMLRETLLSDMGLVSRACRGGCLLSRAVWRLFLFIQPISCSGSPSAAVRKTSGKIPVLMDDLNLTGVLLHKTVYGSGPAQRICTFLLCCGIFPFFAEVHRTGGGRKRGRVRRVHAIISPNFVTMIFPLSFPFSSSSSSGT